jgi:uncharacterized membrane protein YgdD (TMEM256/DUF423 family)
MPNLSGGRYIALSFISAILEFISVAFGAFAERVDAKNLKTFSSTP